MERIERPVSTEGRGVDVPGPSEGTKGGVVGKLGIPMLILAYSMPAVSSSAPSPEGDGLRAEIRDAYIRALQTDSLEVVKEDSERCCHRFFDPGSRKAIPLDDEGRCALGEIALLAALANHGLNRIDVAIEWYGAYFALFQQMPLTDSFSDRGIGESHPRAAAHRARIEERLLQRYPERRFALHRYGIHQIGSRYHAAVYLRTMLALGSARPASEAVVALRAIESQLNREYVARFADLQAFYVIEASEVAGDVAGVRAASETFRRQHGASPLIDVLLRRELGVAYLVRTKGHAAALVVALLIWTGSLIVLVRQRRRWSHRSGEGGHPEGGVREIGRIPGLPIACLGIGPIRLSIVVFLCYGVASICLAYSENLLDHSSVWVERPLLAYFSYVGCSFVLFPLALIAARSFYVRTGSIFCALGDQGIIVSRVDRRPAPVADPQELQRKTSHSLCHPAVAATSLLLAVIVFSLMKATAGDPGTSIFDTHYCGYVSITGAVLSAEVVLVYYVFISFIIRVAVFLVWTARFVAMVLAPDGGLEVRISPYHPDGVSGFRGFGHVAFCIDVVVGAIGMLAVLAAIEVSGFYSSIGVAYLGAVFSVGLFAVAYLIICPLLVFFPVHMIHRILKVEKGRITAMLSSDLRSRQERLFAAIQAGEGLDAGLLEEIRAVGTTLHDYSSMNAWPINWRSLWKVIGTYMVVPVSMAMKFGPRFIEKLGT